MSPDGRGQEIEGVVEILGAPSDASRIMDPIRSTRSLRTRLSQALCVAGMLLSLLGLAVAALETISFGHVHLAEDHPSQHHRHLFFGSHEHPHGTRPKPDHDHGRDHDHDHDQKAPKGPRKTATIAGAPALFLPLPIVVLSAPLADSAPVAPQNALPPLLLDAARLTNPRAPPAAIAASELPR